MIRLRVFFEQCLVGTIDIDKGGTGFTYDSGWIGLRGAFPILADLKSGGSTRPVIMQANKNGFFYVLDRRTGKLISAKNFTFVNWASNVDMRTGRPRQ